MQYFQYLGPLNTRESKGLASYCKAETTFTFHFSILTLSNAFLGIDNREMKSESGFSFAIASQPLAELYCYALCYISLCKVLINSQKFIVEGVGVNQLSACT